MSLLLLLQSAAAVTVAGVSTPYEGQTVTSAVIPVPAGAAVGEYLLAEVAHSSTGATVPVIATPSGWTKIGQADGVGNGSQGVALFYRPVMASEPASYTFPTNSTAGRVSGIMARLAGVNSTTQLDGSVVTASTASTVSSVTIAAVSTVTDGALAIYAASLNASSAADINTPAELTLQAKTTGTGRRAGMYSEARPTAGAGASRTFTQTTTNLQWAVIGVAFRPAAGSTETTIGAESAAGATDAVTTSLDANRSAASAAGATDAVTTSLEAQRTVADTAGATDDVSVAMHYMRTASSGAGATDSASASLAALRSAASSAGAVDTASTAMDYGRSASSAAGAVDAVSTTSDMLRTTASTAAATDSVTAQLVSPGTRFYLPSSGTAAVNPGASTAWNITTGFAARPAPTTKSGTARVLEGLRTRGQTTAGARSRLMHVFVSDPLNAQTIAGTFSAALQGLESSIDHNSWLNIAIRVVSGDGTVQRGLGYTGSALSAPSATPSDEAGEWDLTEASRVKSGVALTPVDAQAGDRLVIEVGYRSTGVVSSQGCRYVFGDPAGSSDLPLEAGVTVTTQAPWVELSQVLTFAPPGVDVQRTASSAAGASDEVSRSLDATRGAVSVAGATDAVSASLAAVRSPASAAGAVDDVAVSMAYGRSAVSAAGASDEVVASLEMLRSATSTAGATDNVTWTITTFQGAYDVEYSDPRTQTTSPGGPVRAPQTRAAGIRTASTDAHPRKRT